MSQSENIVSFPDRKAAEETAAFWVARFDTRGSLSAEDHTALENWLTESPYHPEALRLMADLWGSFGLLDQLNYLDTDDDALMGQPSWLRRMAIVGAVVASLMLAVFGVLYSGTYSGPALHSGEYVTAIGEQQTVHLVDGSTIILNTGSRVAVDFTHDARLVYLCGGEAHFEVAHDPDRPFLVHAGTGVVKAVGTAFSVFLKGEAVEVTVSEGVVALLKNEETRPEAKRLDNDLQPLSAQPTARPIAALTAGQSAVFSEAVESVVTMSDGAIGRKLMWREGFIAFAGEPLSEVVDQISRYTDIVIHIDDPALGAMPIGGYFKIGNVDDMFEALETSFDITVTRDGDKGVNLSRAS